MIPGFFKKTSGYRALHRAWQKRMNPLGANPFIRFAPPGHFYSPLPDVNTVERYRLRLFDRQTPTVPGIDVRSAQQLALLGAFAQLLTDMPFTPAKKDGVRYYLDNPFFRYGDGLMLYSVLRHFRPRRVIEVGSGFSSALMLDVNERFLSNTASLTFIEPYPERLFALMTAEDRQRHEVIVAPVQDVPLELFDSLQPHDMLFIDSSHVAKVGSDVVHLLSYVLPRLKAGVFVHIHDIFWPFEYPERWIREGRAWNEIYVVRAFLQFNSSFEILIFNSYLAVHHGHALGRALPPATEDTGASLWLEKTR